jgi:hypothetical protein
MPDNWKFGIMVMRRLFGRRRRYGRNVENIKVQKQTHLRAGDDCGKRKNKPTFATEMLRFS